MEKDSKWVKNLQMAMESLDENDKFDKEKFMALKGNDEVRTVI